VKRIIYLDNAATTPIRKEVFLAMKSYWAENFGNPGSITKIGLEARQAVEAARKIIAESIFRRPTEIIFTSGGTEANNFAIKGLAFAHPEKKHLITTKIEHDCVMNSCKWLQTKGYDVTYLNVDKEGFVSPEDLEKAIRKDTLLFSCIHGNNEIGTI